MPWTSETPLYCYFGYLGRGAKVNVSSPPSLLGGSASLLTFKGLHAPQPRTSWSGVGSGLRPWAAPQLLCLSSSPRSLLILFVEIDYWERLLFETPHYVANVAERAEDLRILRENLLLLARDYNRWGPRCSPLECHFMLPLCLIRPMMLSISYSMRPSHFVHLKKKKKKRFPCSLVRPYDYSCPFQCCLLALE